jgi:uncharacterized membrane protein YsdA (DUF1294 family)
MSGPDQFALAWFGGWSVVTFCAFAYDKWRAGRSGPRVSELTLVMLGALGGWLGGIAGMSLFQHKIAKWTFKLKYAFALLPFAAELWVWWHWR